MCAVNWHITDCRQSMSHRQILASLLLLRACDDVSAEAANRLGPLSKITSIHIRAQIPTIQYSHARAKRVPSTQRMWPCTDWHINISRGQFLKKTKKPAHKHDQKNLLTSLHVLRILTLENMHMCAHTHTHILPTDKTQLWTQSSAPASYWLTGPKGFPALQ